MALFLATYLNKLDRKGRVSVPASFRAGLVSPHFSGVVLFASHKYAAIEAWPYERLEKLSQSLDQLDVFSATQDDVATTVFGGAMPQSFDSEGRISLPESLISHAAIHDQVAFVGLGQTFQLWEPSKLAAHRAAAAERARSNALPVKLSDP